MPSFKNNNPKPDRQAAINIIKDRIKSMYPSGAASDENYQPASLVDRFWHQHKDHPDPQSAWQKYYDGLSNIDKQRLWNEYNQSSQTQQASTSQIEYANSERSKVIENQKTQKIKAIIDSKKNLIDRVKNNRSNVSQLEINAPTKRKSHWMPLMVSISIMTLWLFAQYNPLLFALAKQYISPGDTLRSPIIVDPSANVEIGSESKIIIPKINVDVPVVYNLETRDEHAIQNALEEGVVHYADTGLPGEAGNNVIVGHSSNNFLNSGKYKFAFVLLDRLEVNDTFILHYNKVRYVYKVTNKQVVEPTDFSLIQPTKNPTATLITCTPPGTSWKRLIIQGEQISPSIKPSQTIQEIPTTNVQNEDIVPGNAPSLWSRFVDWIF